METDRMVRALVVVAMFIAAAGLRLVSITEPPLDFHATRQYRSALISRELWLSWTSDPSDDELEIARAAAPDLYEPPVLETITAAAYTVIGGESLLIPRCLAIIGWLVGGGAVLLLLLRVAGDFGAIAGTAVWLFAPFAVMASRSFQPDPWMVAAIAWFAVAAERYARRPRLAGVVGCGALAALAVVLKPVSVFQVGAAFLAVAWSVRRQSGVRWWRHVALFGLVTLAPSLPYYLYRWMTGPLMGDILELSLRPELLVTIGFWRGWIAQVWKVTGLLAAGMVAVAVAVVARASVRWLLLGLAAGYVVFVMVFIYQGFTHDYYHLQLFPMVSIGVGLVAQRALDAIIAGSELGRRRAVLLAGAVVILASADAALGAYDRLRRLDFSSQVETYVEVGRVVDHTTRSLMLSDYYSYPLRYHGRVAGRAWPQWYDFRLHRILGVPEVGAAQRLDTMTRTVRPRYFIVTDFDEYRRQDDLRLALERGHPVHASGAGYLVFDLTKRLSGGPVETGPQ